jgi:hypothetical protein
MNDTYVSSQEVHDFIIGIGKHSDFKRIAQHCIACGLDGRMLEFYGDAFSVVNSFRDEPHWDNISHIVLDKLQIELPKLMAMNRSLRLTPIKLSNVNGDNKEFEGIYILSDEVQDEWPVYQHLDNADIWLEHSDYTWMFRKTKYRDTIMCNVRVSCGTSTQKPPSAYCHGCVEVFRNNVWEKQPQVTITEVIDEPERGSSVPTTQTKPISALETIASKTKKKVKELKLLSLSSQVQQHERVVSPSEYNAKKRRKI